MRTGGPSRPAGLRLDDVLDVLAGSEGRQLVEQTRDRLADAGIDFEGPVVQAKGGAAPRDDFEALAGHFLTHSFLTRARGKAALPNAMVWALAHASDANGMLTPEGAAKLGAGGAQIYKKLDELLAGGARDVPTQRRRTKYMWFTRDVQDKIGRSAPSGDLRTRMPVLAELTRNLGGEKALEGLKMASVQHLFPTTEGLFDALADCGLDPKDAIIHGKNYSTNEDVLYRMRSRGWNVPEFAICALPSGTGKGHMNIAGNDLATLFDGVEPEAKPEKPRFLLLDEGGKMLDALHRHFPEHANLCVAIEQTDRGLQVIEELALEGMELKCPVVNVARSSAKKVFESPMIGESVAHSTLEALKRLHPDLSVEPKVATILGYGAVGKATADALKRRGFEIRAWDVDPARRALAEAEGCIVGERNDLLKDTPMVVSCTGRRTMVPTQFDELLPDGCILVNAASGNHELGLDQIEGGPGFLTDDPLERVDEEGFRRSTFKGLDVELGDLAGDEQMFSRVLRSESGAERLALRSGYVVNMVDDIPPELIQLTRGLLLAACLQAPKHHGEPGLVELDPKVADFVVSRTERHLKKLGVDPMKPDFRRLAPAES